jgi:hypothetical protein
MQASDAITTGVIPKDIRGNGRFDAVIYKLKEKQPRFVMEVKFVRNSTSLDSDIKRIAKVIATKPKSNTLQSGIIAFYAQKKVVSGAVGKLEALLDDVCDRAGNNIREGQKVIFSHSMIDGENNYASAAACIFIRNN